MFPFLGDKVASNPAGATRHTSQRAYVDVAGQNPNLVARVFPLPAQCTHHL
ncbi:Uncharacterised protein [Vibrio cholerae]|nr:Uncharacterised protein [Vibrio cholerae]